MKVQELYKKYLVKKANYERLERQMMNNMDSESLEELCDAYYENIYYPSFTELVDEVMKLTKCTIKIAREIIESNNFEKLMAMQIA